MNELFWIIAGILLLSIFVFFIIKKKNPAFYDFFGFFAFMFFFVAGIWLLFSKLNIPNVITYPMIIFSVIGLLVDGGTIIKTLTSIFRKKKNIKRSNS